MYVLLRMWPLAMNLCSRDFIIILTITLTIVYVTCVYSTWLLDVT